jgi:hypothetical protein
MKQMSRKRNAAATRELEIFQLRINQFNRNEPIAVRRAQKRTALRKCERSECSTGIIDASIDYDDTMVRNYWAERIAKPQA